MKIPGSQASTRLLWAISAAAVLTAGAAILYPAARSNKVYASQEKEAAGAGLHGAVRR